MNVVVVSGICVERDAVSNAVADQLRVLTAAPQVDHVTLVTQGRDRDVAADVVVVTASPWELSCHPAVRAADLVVFHWAIAYDLFDALVVMPRPGRRVAIHFHNITPGSLLTGEDRAKELRSRQQAELLVDLDVEVWTYSEFNRRTLLGWGVPAERLHDVPLPITVPPGLRRHRRTDGVDLLTVGRLVPAKGVHVLLDALAAVPPAVRARLTATVAGSIRLSDADYVDELRRRIDTPELTGVVRLVDDPDDDALWELYGGSHVVVSPSFHEGLCVPVIEGYLAGCRAIGTTAGNLPFVVTAPDPLVPPGDAAALAAAIERVAAELLDRTTADPGAQLREPPPVARAFSADRAASALLERVEAAADAPARGGRDVTHPLEDATTDAR